MILDSQNLDEPIHKRNLYPFFQGFIAYIPQGITDGRTRTTSIQMTASNYYRYDNHILNEDWELWIDGEDYQWLGEQNIPLPHNWNSRISLPLVFHSPGVFDPAIQSFHHLFGFPNGGREHHPDNVAMIHYTSPQYKYTNDSKNWGVQSLTYTIITPSLGNRWLVQGQGGIKLPSINPAFPLGYDTWDYQLLGILYRDLGPWTITLNGGLAYWSDPHILDIPFSEFSLLYGVMASWKVNSTQRVLVQIHGQTSPYESGHSRIDYDSRYITVGYRTLLSRNVSIDTSFTQEFLSYATSDIAVNLGLTYHH
ncbi:DUF3187 family protein [Spirochaeta cellobiosiphila]|uniref:DUF3187 family protein n=1 Tax=Spirochaeta cellobiosiphila TaxID=504483 RepID=UPI0003F8A6C5|nr:DUF3187 family protein [Spirochaeta cellobiosiphila]